MTAARRPRSIARAAPAPPPRTVEVELDGDFAGWRCTARRDFPATTLERLVAMTERTETDQRAVLEVIAIMEELVVAHNFPDSDGALAERMFDVAPFDGVLVAARLVFAALGKLPNRNGPPS